MAGEYGIGAGIAQGLNQVAQGFKDTTQQDTNRLKIQQDAAKFNLDMQRGQTQQQTADLQLQQTQLALDEMQKEIAKKDTWNTLMAFEYSGAGTDDKHDASILNTIKGNKIMDSYLTNNGITSFANVSDLSEARKAELGITPEILSNPATRVVIANKSDGSQVPMDMMKVYASTGFLPVLGKQKLEDISLRANEIKASTAELQYQDMTKWLQANPDKTYNDYVAIAKKRQTVNEDTADIKNLKFMSEQTGKPVSQIINERQQQKADSSIPSTIKVAEHNVGIVNTMKQESGVDNLYDVNYNKLSKDNKTRFDQMVKDDAKNIKAEEYTALASLEAAADKLNTEDLKSVTGIADATFNSIFDTLGLDLPDKTLIQSGNYNLIKNLIVRTNSGQTVTGNELDRMTAQIGNEFKSDSTVRIKTAETLDNIAAKYEAYKTTAPALYARILKPKVENMHSIANYLRNPEGGKKPSETSKPTSGYKIGTIVTNTKDNTKWKYLGGDVKDQKNWKEVKE
jgi:hypothetical protein